MTFQEVITITSDDHVRKIRRKESRDLLLLELDEFSFLRAFANQITHTGQQFIFIKRLRAGFHLGEAVKDPLQLVPRNTTLLT